MSGWIYMSAADWTNRYATPGERLFLGFTMMLVGVVIVFLLLLTISWAIRVMPLFMRKKRPAAPQAQAGGQSTPPALQATEPAIPPQEDGQLVAVISAALAASMSESSNRAASALPGAGFRVRRIRRLG